MSKDQKASSGPTDHVEPREAAIDRFTPGPWSVSNGHLLRICRADGRGSSVTICGVHRIGVLTTGERTHEVHANARLIAAAPTMADFITKHAEAGDPEARKLMEAIRGNS